MKVKFLQSRKTLALILGVVLLLLLLGALLIPGGSAKYRTQVVQANTVSFDDRLASAFTLTHEQAADGVFRAELLPGKTETFEPVITVTGKTEIPAWLYLEIKGPADAAAGEDWVELTGVTGKNGGRMYAYADVLTNANGADFTISPAITVTWSAVPSENTDTTLQIFAYMIQRESPEITAQAAFVEAVPQS